MTTRGEYPASSNRWRRLMRPLVLALVLAVLITLPILAVTGLNNLPINLSKRAELGMKSAHPDVDVSSDGQYVAVTWSRGYDLRPETKGFGNIVLKSADVITGWELQVNVYTATSTLWGHQPQIVFDPLNRSRVYIIWRVCLQTSQCHQIKMAVCNLASFPDSCQQAELVEDAGSDNLSMPDIAADNNGRLHAVWKNDTDGRIQYNRRSGGAWSDAAPVSDSNGNSYDPALVWGGDRLHLTWYQYHSNQASRRIRYSSDLDLSNEVWNAANETQWDAPPLHEFTGGTDPTIKPRIASNGTYVYIVWDAYKDTQDLVLAYDWSADNGALWQDSFYDNTGLCGANEDGCGIPNSTDFAANPVYNSPRTSIDEQDALRPDVAISGTVPVLVWHFRGYPGGENAAYLLVCQDSIRTGGSIVWNEPITITDHINYDPSGGTEDDAANPSLALWSGGRAHIGFMGLWGGDPSDEYSDWDIYYRGVVITDTSSVPDEPTPTRTATLPPAPGQPTATPTVYPYDDLRRDYMPVTLKN